MPEEPIPSVRDLVEFPAVVLGRLLLSGVLGGTLVGLLASLVLAVADDSWGTWGAGVAFLGALLGLVAGPLAQAVTAAFVLRSSATGPAVRTATVAVPTASALVLSLAVLSRLTVAGPVQVAVVLTAVLVTASVAALTSGWCLAPLMAVRHGRRTATRPNQRD